MSIPKPCFATPLSAGIESAFSICQHQKLETCYSDISKDTDAISLLMNVPWNTLSTDVCVQAHLNLRQARQPELGIDSERLRLEVETSVPDLLHVKITDARRRRWEVPQSLLHKSAEYIKGTPSHAAAMQQPCEARRPMCACAEAAAEASCAACLPILLPVLGRQIEHGPSNAWHAELLM